MQKQRLALFIFLFLTCVQSTVLAADIAREKRIADNIRDSILVGEVVDLKAGADDFIALVTNNEPANPRGSIIILHGMNSNPNAPQIIHPLRSQLAESGWVTASIQLPLAAADASINDNLALIKESHPRIRTTLSYMHENFQNRPCVLIAHSLGAIMATSFLAEQKELACDAMVLIGLPKLTSDLPEADGNKLLKKVGIPTLDIYGSQDLDHVKSMAASRKLILMKTNKLNRQVEIAGADHAFNGLDETLVRAIHSWLLHTFEPPKH